MKIIIVGCGKIGTTLLSNLVSEGHDVTVIDNNPAVVREATNIHDAIGVCGNGADCETLEEANAASADLVIAATASDELNMLSCFMAKRLGAKYTIARIRNPEYNDQSLGFILHQLDLSMSINPELMAAKELFALLRLPSAAKVETFSVNNFEIIELRLKANSPLDGMKLSDLRSKYKQKFLICAVGREDKAYIPDGNFVLKSGDKIGLTATRGEISSLLKDLGIQKKQSRSVMIMGGSKIAYYLAKMLMSTGISVTVIEKNPAICEEFSETLPKAIIINGDGTDQELLLENGLKSVDSFVALTGMDEANILISSFAASQNLPQVIAKVNRDELIPLAEQWGLDCIISPKKLVADKLLQYARALDNSQGSSMETLYKLMDEKVEVLEFSVKPDFPELSIPLKELKTKPNTLFAGIIRNRKIIIPSGNDILLAGDRVVVLAANQRINALSDILK